MQNHFKKFFLKNKENAIFIQLSCWIEQIWQAAPQKQQ